MTYARRGFIANKVASDKEFRIMEAPLSMQGMVLNVVARNGRVPKAERHIRTTKEKLEPYSTRCRSRTYRMG